jgi:hypothetical protein
MCYDITDKGVSHYANPADYEQDFSVSLMNGSHTGTLASVASTSNVTLQVGEDLTSAEALGRWLLITSGSGINQAQQIKTYTVATRVAVLDQVFATTPVTADGYMVVTQLKDLRYKHPKLYDKYDHPGSPGEPTVYTSLKNNDVGWLALYPVPDATYGLRRRYYADLRLLDTDTATGVTIYETILRRWAGLFEQGVYVWKLGEDDDRFSSESQIYYTMLQATAAIDLDGPANAAGLPVTASTKAT